MWYGRGMITTTNRRCESCGSPATRQVYDRPNPETGFRLRMWFCGSCPDPEQIDNAARVIADGWSPAQMAARIFGCGVSQVEYHQRVDVVVCSVMADDGPGSE